MCTVKRWRFPALPIARTDRVEGATCRNPACQRPLSGTWDQPGPFCCNCALEFELFHRETRWPNGSIEAEAAPRKSEWPRKRARSMRSRVVRFGMKTLAAVVPAAAEERAARMFFTPQRTARWTAPNVTKLPANTFRLSTEEHEIAAWSWGRGPAVLLVHGWAGYGAQLVNFVEPLVRAGFRAVTFDMPGHGASTGRELTVIDMSRAIRAVAQVAGPTHAVIAHSLGGTAAIWALRNGLEAKRLVLLAPAAEPTHFALALATAIGLPAVRAPGMLERIESRVGIKLADFNVARLVSEMTARLLVIHDPEDPEVPFDHGEAIAVAWPGARIERAAGMAHRGMLRNPGLIQKTVAFVSSQSRSSKPCAAATS